MASRSEEHLLTLFADVHYYFSPPDQRPPHHRFDKGSYVYLYQIAGQSRGRLEIANHPGTSNQDAVSGYLDTSYLQYSHKHPTLCTVTVHGPPQEPNESVPPPPPPDGSQQWHLLAPDHRNEGRYMFRLHTLDIYFWTKEDAIRFVESAKKVISPAQVKVLDGQMPVPTHNEPVSNVVQKLEHMAFAGTEDRRSQHSIGRPQSTSSSHQSAGGPATGVESNQAQVGQQTTGYAPLAYNPAAPAAPEPIKHREKTPPPPDAANGTGLAHAAAQDSGRPVPPPASHYPSAFSPPPSGPQPGLHQPFPGPPPQPLPPHMNAPSSTGPYQGAHSSPLHLGSPYPAPPNSAPYASPPPSVSDHTSWNQHHPQHSIATGHDPNAQLYGLNSPPLPSGALPGAYPPAYAPSTTAQYYQPQLHQPPNPPPPQQFTGYSQPPSAPPSGAQAPGYPFPATYPGQPYAQPPHMAQPSDPAAIHSQVYRPNEAETGSHNKPSGSGTGSTFDTQTARLEKGVGKLLKKLEKKF